MDGGDKQQSTNVPGKRQLGDFEILREIGRGGMGVVYEAVQLSLGRKVALKVLSSGLGLTPQAVQRFQKEAESAARLHHTNIIPIYATGSHDGIYFYAMELIEGPSLDHVIRQMRGAEKGGPTTETPVPADGSALTAAYESAPRDSGSGSAVWTSSSLSSVSQYFDTVARMVAEVADALAYAHKQGVVHRDIKPANLLVAPEGRLSLNDFGLARVLEQPGMTATGEILGTPAYMSPEQITAGRTSLDHRTDIYSLGATLYELLALRPPFAGERRDQVLTQILHKEPRPPRTVNKKVPVDLDTICLKAMEKDPDRRYQSAGDMAEDLRRYANRFAISARRAGPLTKSMKWAKRNPSVAVLFACLVAVLLVASYFVHASRLTHQQLVSEQRQATVDNAILEAMSGDAQVALQAIAEAERKGVEPGQLNMLRGVVERHRGRPKEALVYLEQADKQLPQSVAVKALLAAVYVDDGQWQRYDQMYTLLEHLAPATSEDFLFLGLVEAEADPLRALQTLQRAPTRSRQSAVARLARAVAMHNVVELTGRKEDAERALDALRIVDLPDNPLLLNIRIRTRLAAAFAYGFEDPRSKELLQQATGDVQQLAEYPDNKFAIFARYTFFFALGDTDAVLEESRRAKRTGGELGSYATEMVASVFYERKQFDEALQALELSKSGGYESWTLANKGIVLAAMAGRKEDSAEAFREAFRTSQGGVSSVSMPAFLQVLGPEYKAESQQAALEVRRKSSHLVPVVRNRWYHDLLAFNAGVMSDAELLVRAGESRRNLLEAHFYVGLRRLAEGNRGEAKKSFRSASQTNVLGWTEHTWSRAFLILIDDEDWLPWVAMKLE